MNLNIKPIGVIKRFNAGLADIIVYSDFEHILKNIVKKLRKGTFLLIIHKNNKTPDAHQVQISSAELIDWNGNILRVKGLEPDNDTLIDVRLVEMLIRGNDLKVDN